MITTLERFTETINSPVRMIGARVELYEGSTLTQIFKYTDALRSFKVERIGEENKFFGFGVCHKLNVKLMDTERKIKVSTANTIEIEFGVGYDYMYPYPKFYVTEVHRDENTNELSITAYDRLYAAANYTVADLEIDSYTIKEFAEACAPKLGLPLDIVNVADSSFDTEYQTQANFSGTESLREALNDVAEVTQTIYYINHDWALTFKRLDINGEPALTITKDKYFSLDSKTNRRLAAICHATELGDNVQASMSYSGTTQYIRNNPFWELREDIDVLVNAALDAVGGLTINQFDCSWRGDFTLEIGDKIALVTKDNKTVVSYILNDTINYNGFLSERTKWQYTNSEEEEAANASNIGDAIKQTYARVDKINKQIDLVVSKSEDNTEKINQLQITSENINASVQQVTTNLSNKIDGTNNDLASLTERVNASMTSTDVKLEIQAELAKGTSRVSTTTGYTFNEEGLSIEKTGSEMKTLITEDGMSVYRDSTKVLTANNIGVVARNLHAETYLTIGTNSRFEDYEGGRTGCFWIGG